MRNTLTICFAALCCAFTSYAGGLLQGVHLGGFVSNGYLDSSDYNYLVDSEDGSAEFVEIGLNASWTLHDRTTLNGQLFAFELGRYGNYKPLIDYLFVDYNFSREFGIRAGRVKREFGVYTHVQDIDVSRASVLLPMGVYDQRFRDISASLDGISTYGNIDLWNGAYLDYSLYGGFVNLEADGGIAGHALTSVSRLADNIRLEYVDSKYNYGGQIWLNPGVEGLRLGFGMTKFTNLSAATNGEVPQDTLLTYLAGMHFRSELTDYDLIDMKLAIEYFIGEWNFAGEYIATDVSLTTTTDIAGLLITSDRTNFQGDAWYLSGSRRFGKFEASVTYSESYSDKQNRRGIGTLYPNSAYSRDTQFSVRFDATDFWSLKAEVHNIEGTSRLFNEFEQNPVLDVDSWRLFAAKSTFTF